MSRYQHTPEECLRAAVDALGGLQRVGHALRPELDPVSAGQWLAHCLTPGKRDKLSLAQESLIWRRAFDAGQHQGFEAYAELHGYRVVAIEPQAELQELSRRAESAAREAMELSTRVIEQMRHAHLNVSA